MKKDNLCDMKTILLTGASGFIGRNIAPSLSKSYHLLTPTRSQLNLLNRQQLKAYFLHYSHSQNGRIAAVVHCAFPTGHNPLDKPEGMYENTMNMFENIESCRGFYDRMIYFGSGAEFAKHRDIINITEEDIGEVIPKDDYGLVRYKINQRIRKYGNAYNLRLFGCYGPYDPPHKFITHVIDCIGKNQPITIKQNAKFDFLYVKDLAGILKHFIEDKPAFKDYNVCTGMAITLEQIARRAIESLKAGNSEIVFEQSGFNLEYTGDNARLMQEFKDIAFTPLEDGICDFKKWIDSEKGLTKK